MSKCEHPGCKDEGQELYFPDGSLAPSYCYEHMGENGFCIGCGAFWGGIESFEFFFPPHLCDNCRWSPEWNDEPEWYWDEDEEYDYEG